MKLLQELNFVDSQTLFFTGIQFRRLEILVNLRGCLASKVRCHKVIYIGRFVVIRVSVPRILN